MELKQKIFVWLHWVFSYIVPGGVALWSCVIEKLLDKEITIVNKVGITGVFAMAVMVIIAVFFYNKHLNKKITDLTNRCIECIDNEEKVRLVEQKKKMEVRLEIFHNICFVVPFVIVWLVLCFVESGVISLRGTMLVICLSMATGLGLNTIAGFLKTKGVKNENKATNTGENQ